jgi:hypothetical protein
LSFFLASEVASASGIGNTVDGTILAKGANAAPLAELDDMHVHALSRSLLFLTPLFLGHSFSHSQQPSTSSDLRIVIYQDEFAQITQRFKSPGDWTKGLNRIRLSDLPGTLDPATFRLRSLTDPSAIVTEQTLTTDTIAADKLLARSIDKRIIVHAAGGQKREGVLLGYDATQLVLAAEKDRGPVWLLNRGQNLGRVQFPELTEATLTRPVLNAAIETSKPGVHDLELSYLAGRLRWRADYTLVLNSDDSAGDLQGWVVIDNQSGTSFDKATIKLLAGESRLESAAGPWGIGLDAYKYARRSPPTDKMGADASRPIGEYRAYTLAGRLQLPDRQLKQVELLNVPKVAVTKTYLIDGGQVTGLRGERNLLPAAGLAKASRPAHVLLEIENRADQQLGITLPRGKLRVYKRDSAGELGNQEFLGEDLVLHTSRDDRLILHVGNAFDIMGERKQLAFQRVTDQHIEESLEIRVRNRKAEPVTVQVLERLFRGTNWELIEHSHDPQRLDGRTVLFPVSIPAEGEAVVTYRVRYRF